MAPTLREQVWSIGNIVSFAVSNFEEAYELAQQIFPYNANTVKLAPKADNQQPVIEPDRGQYLQIANDLQRMQHRECIIRRYMSEKILDKYVLWVKKTKNVPAEPTEMSISEFKDMLLKERGVRVRDSLQVVNQRSLESTVVQKVTPPHL